MFTQEQKEAAKNYHKKAIMNGYNPIQTQDPFEMLLNEALDQDWEQDADKQKNPQHVALLQSLRADAMMELYDEHDNDDLPDFVVAYVKQNGHRILHARFVAQVEAAFAART